MVIVPATDAPRYAITIAPLTGGRRLLSDDLETLEAIAVVVARRIDAIRMTRERYERQLREQEMTALATEAELRALRAQINPHFLFNALTTIGYLVKAAPDRALDTLMRLTALLRGVLRSEGEYTTLGREIELIESYLEIEHARFEQRLRVRIDVPAHLRRVRVPPLLLQPVVENAVKHGIAPRRLGGEVTVSARFDDASDGPHVLSLLGPRQRHRIDTSRARTRTRARASACATSSGAWRVSTARRRRSRFARRPARARPSRSGCRPTPRRPRTLLKWMAR